MFFIRIISSDKHFLTLEEKKKFFLHSQGFTIPPGAPIGEYSRITLKPKKLESNDEGNNIDDIPTESDTLSLIGNDDTQSDNKKFIDPEYEAIKKEIAELKIRKEELIKKDNILKLKSATYDDLLIEVSDRLEKENEKIDKLLNEKEDLEKQCKEEETRLLVSIKKKKK